VTVRWRSAIQAEVVRNALQVDSQLQPEVSRETFESNDANLNIKIEATDYRILRMKVNSLYENLVLMAAVIEAFS